MRTWRSEDGWVLVTAMILMTVMLGIGVATAAMIDTQAQQSGKTRQRDTAFNLAEAALNAQVYELSQRWPGAGYASNASYQNYACTNAGPTPSPEPTPSTALPAVAPLMCPSSATLAPLLNNVDARGGTPVATWRTRVYDDPSSTSSVVDRGKFYSDALMTNHPNDPGTGNGVGYDSNNNGRLWVNASATVRGRTRTLVSLVKIETFQVDVINTVLLAGALDFSNQGNHSGFFIDQTGASVTNALTVRCNPTNPPTADCLGYPVDVNGNTEWATKIGGAINPPTYVPGYTGGNALDPATLDEFKKDAMSVGTYYDAAGTVPGHTCSALSQPPVTTFDWLYIKDCPNVGWSSNSVLNSPEKGGMVILDDSRLTIQGGVTINGIVYARNVTGLMTASPTTPIVDVHGCAQIAGGLIIDDNGLASIGSCSQADHPDLVFSPTQFETVKTFASAGIIQNTWRELTAGT